MISKRFDGKEEGRYDFFLGMYVYFLAQCVEEYSNLNLFRKVL